MHAYTSTAVNVKFLPRPSENSSWCTLRINCSTGCLLEIKLLEIYTLVRAETDYEIKHLIQTVTII